ncbi:type I secretion system permease/ATPase [Ancylobacter dichloromethanicus]|uniref:Type I secretion protein n=1 Tax=Ancylobacter dichloromethanicus TaxID=518825 RepID=A0A9W6JAH9_9HYPH|nr:type I secretion system permease/ATPase [Ancylobacter dichloromethanicus]MBS7555906.1 type I secretion system permease/ATPase [Ancylobacter dichloromethanicus]GLK72449.1 type I secretion protein [Ancylobacter dichloromethanicus]
MAPASPAASLPATPLPAVARALSSCRGAFLAVGAFSAVINVLMLSGSLYMLQVYDRVLSSRSVPTLIGLSLLLLAAYALQGFLDAVRVRMLARIGARFDEQVSPAAFGATRRLSLAGRRPEEALQPIRDLDQIRAFLSSLGPTALFDMPWMPLFFAGCFLLHPWLGWLALAGGMVIVALTAITELASRAAAKAQMASRAARETLAEASRRNAEVLTAMGMAPAFEGRWHEANLRHVRAWLAAADLTGGSGAFAKVFRMVLQSAVLGLGAYLAMHDEISGGAMIAASIMTSRALAPIEIAVANWKGFVAARLGVRRLGQVLALPAMNETAHTRLPAPCHALTADNLVVAAPGRQAPILNGITLRVEAGQGLAVIGPSASGKSTLVRALVGVWRPLKGEVRLDGAALDQWAPEALGRHVGYLPQDVELFEGTVAENIARFDPQATDEAVVAAARSAGAHELILRLEEGYDTRIGEAGMTLSGGQRQRLGLARALYGSPFLVVLDEPNSNLDHDGDEALTHAVEGVRARGGIVLMVTHRQSAIAGLDRIAMMAEGRLQAIGPKEEVLARLARQGGLPGIKRAAVAS